MVQYEPMNNKQMCEDGLSPAEDLMLIPFTGTQNDKFPYPFLAFDDEDMEDENDLDEEDGFDDMDDDFDDDFDDDDDDDDFDDDDEDDYDYDEDVDYDDDFEE
jgi:hypothetical protein